MREQFYNMLRGPREDLTKVKQYRRISLEDTFQNSSRIGEEYSRSFVEIMDRAIAKANSKAQKLRRKRPIEEYQAFVSPIQPTQTKKKEFKVRKQRDLSVRPVRFQHTKLPAIAPSSETLDILFDNNSNSKELDGNAKYIKKLLSNRRKYNVHLHKGRKITKTETSIATKDHSTDEVKQNCKTHRKENQQWQQSDEANHNDPIVPWAIREQSEAKDNKYFY